ncbi:MAG: O-methyltransferase [Thermoplasmata archaeon]
MGEIDTEAILRTIYGERMMLHHDLYEASEDHREDHGEWCAVYPNLPQDAPLWPFLTAVLGARRFLEVGCGLGYTTALMAEAGGPESQVDTVESNGIHAELAESELARRGLADRVNVLHGQAHDILPSLSEPYDVVFVDSDWQELPDWIEHFARLTREGGLLVSGNVYALFEEWAAGEGYQERIQEYLEKLVGDDRFQTYIIPDTWLALSYRVQAPL